MVRQGCNAADLASFSVDMLTSNSLEGMLLPLSPGYVTKITSHCTRQSLQGARAGIRNPGKRENFTSRRQEHC
jgi:hypothetical protein